ncbi:hypothetical protein [Escherichia coli]|uniref:hypothetical protein n=1 Tax=Escherichia coli TaxID=562 RepID=UPI00228EACAF|nr:hypothetical protein [Escherichia coli]WBZ46898.1 hypothetical protein PIC92_24765 [Escherichia coli]HCY3172671.1 hypothetical protein [Escherichia coli]
MTLKITFEHDATGIWYLVSGIWYLVSGIWYCLDNFVIGVDLYLGVNLQTGS